MFDLEKKHIGPCVVVMQENGDNLIIVDDSLADAADGQHCIIERPKHSKQ